MPAKRLSMRKIKEVLRLNASGMSSRKIAQSLNQSRPSVANYLRRAADAGLKWPLPLGLSDAAIEQQLFPTHKSDPGSDTAGLAVGRELKHKALFLLWQEYLDSIRWLPVQPVICIASGVAKRITGLVKSCSWTMPATRWRVNQHTGEFREAQIFIAVLGASNYTYAEATWSQALPDWIGSHQRTFSFLGGVVEIVVPDNLKSGVHKASLYDPDINPTYQDMAEHYGVAVTGSERPEIGVYVVERWIQHCATGPSSHWQN